MPYLRGFEKGDEPGMVTSDSAIRRGTPTTRTGWMGCRSRGSGSRRVTVRRLFSDGDVIGPEGKRSDKLGDVKSSLDLQPYILFRVPVAEQAIE